MSLVLSSWRATGCSDPQRMVAQIPLLPGMGLTASFPWGMWEKIVIPTVRMQILTLFPCFQCGILSLNVPGILQWLSVSPPPENISSVFQDVIGASHHTALWRWGVDLGNLTASKSDHPTCTYTGISSNSWAFWIQQCKSICHLTFSIASLEFSYLRSA